MKSIRICGGVAIALGGLVIGGGCRDEPGVKATPARNPAGDREAAVISRPPAPSRPAGLLPAFRRLGQESGLVFQRNDDIRGERRILEANGGGVAIFDYDGDGLLDVFLTNGCRLPLKTDNRSSPSALFRNRGDLVFEPVSQPSRLVQFGYATGCAVGDYNADGFDDLYVAALGPDALWQNNGDGTFSDSTGMLETNVPQWGSSVAWADINGDSHLDLYVVNYLVESDSSPRQCPNPASPDGYEQCSPAMFDGADDVLFLSDGAGRFLDATRSSGIAGTRGKGLGVVVSDLDGNGTQEIFVANDGEANFLFVAEPPDAGPAPGELRFRDRALASGIALNESGYAQANMGIASGDYDANGTLDLFITTFYGDTNTLYANRGGLSFQDATRESGLAATTRNKLGFGTVFLDVDNDGRLDLFAANGHVDDRTWIQHGEPYRMRPQLFYNKPEATFSDVSEWSGDYFLAEWLGRGAATGDLDRDGRIDLVVSHQLAPSVALRNETPTGAASVVLRLIGTRSNRNGYGARVEVVGASPPLVRELPGGGSFQSSLAPEIHLGLGQLQEVTVRIRWSSGSVEDRTLSVGRWGVIEGRRGAINYQ